MPEIARRRQRWTIRLRTGIRFTDDPAFKGKPRELVAADYVYSLKRWLDPNLKAGGDAALTDLIVGARAVVDAARKPGAQLRLRRADRGPARRRPLHAARSG